MDSSFNNWSPTIEEWPQLDNNDNVPNPSAEDIMQCDVYEDWPQLDTNNNNKPNPFVEDAMQCGAYKGLGRGFHSVPTSAPAPQESRPWSVFDTGNFSENILEGDVAPSQALDISPAFPGIITYDIKKGEKECPICHKTMKGEAPAIRKHIEAIHAKKENMDVRVIPGSSGRTRKAASEGLTQTRTKRRRLFSTAQSVHVSSSAAHRPPYDSTYITVEEYRRLQYELKSLRKQNDYLLQSVTMEAQCQQRVQKDYQEAQRRGLVNQFIRAMDKVPGLLHSLPQFIKMPEAKVTEIALVLVAMEDLDFYILVFRVCTIAVKASCYAEMVPMSLDPLMDLESISHSLPRTRVRVQHQNLQVRLLSFSAFSYKFFGDNDWVRKLPLRRLIDLDPCMYKAKALFKDFGVHKIFFSNLSWSVTRVVQAVVYIVVEGMKGAYSVHDVRITQEKF